MDILPSRLNDVIPSPTIAVAAHYEQQRLVIYVGLVKLQADDTLEFFVPAGHRLKAGDLVTLHLDNRTGVDEYDAELKVYRTSYKGVVTGFEDQHSMLVSFRDFSLVYGMSEVLANHQPGYQHAADSRVEQPLPITPLHSIPNINHNERDNKIGVLVTRTPEQPHTTAMAFLSSDEDDVFIISFPSTFKVQQLQKDHRCSFAIDERASFTFENAIDWNYVLIDAEAYEVPVEHPAYSELKAAFIDKNPWEVAFFSNPEVRLYHLRCLSTLCPSN